MSYFPLRFNQSQALSGLRDKKYELCDRCENCFKTGEKDDFFPTDLSSFLLYVLKPYSKQLTKAVALCDNNKPCENPYIKDQLEKLHF